ncbi:MAG: hypothetical protein ABII01_07580 [Candidatus Woesearchaeota archaeon]
MVIIDLDKMPNIIQWILGISIILVVSLIYNYKYVLSQLENSLIIFKKPNKLLMTAFIDLLFYVSFFFIAMAFLLLIQKKATSLEDVGLDSIKSQLMSGEITEALETQMAGSVEAMRSFVIYFIVILIIALIIALILYTLFKGMIWSNISKTKFTKKFFFRYLRLNFVLMIILLIIMAFFSFFLGESSIDLSPYIIFVFAYFAYLATYFFLIGQKTFKSIMNSIKYGIKLFEKLILPLTLFFIIYLIIFAIIYYLSFLNIPLLSSFAYTILILALFAFIRIFLYDVYINIIKKN